MPQVKPTNKKIKIPRKTKKQIKGVGKTFTELFLERKYSKPIKITKPKSKRCPVCNSLIPVGARCGEVKDKKIIYHDGVINRAKGRGLNDDYSNEPW